MLTKFLKMKPPTIIVFKTENAFEFIFYYYERLYKIGIMEKDVVRDVTFQL